jgi:hypothetical protein
MTAAEASAAVDDSPCESQTEPRWFVDVIDFFYLAAAASGTLALPLCHRGTAVHGMADS